MLSGALRREDDIGRYKDKYEESMNPFEAFKGRVRYSLYPREDKLTRRRKLRERYKL
jgi:homeobox protein cut-like